MYTIKRSTQTVSSLTIEGGIVRDAVTPCIPTIKTSSVRGNSEQTTYLFRHENASGSARNTGVPMQRSDPMQCTDCGKNCRKMQKHHVPPRCEGGTETIPLCYKCHKARHVKHNDFVRWGRKGGKRTAYLYPYIWQRNLKNQESPWVL